MTATTRFFYTKKKHRRLQVEEDRPIPISSAKRCNSLLELLLGSELRGPSAFLLAAVGSLGGETRVALAAHLLLGVELLGERRERRLDNSAPKSENKVKGRLFLDVVVGKSAAVLELLASKDETLLIRGNTLLVLNLGLYVFDGVTGLHIERDGLSREGLDKDLKEKKEKQKVSIVR